jgi:hypothetical protein
MSATEERNSEFETLSTEIFQTQRKKEGKN